MKVNTAQVNDEFGPIYDVCDQSIDENPVYYLEVNSEEVQTRFGAPENGTICIKIASRSFSLYGG